MLKHAPFLVDDDVLAGPFPDSDRPDADVIVALLAQAGALLGDEGPFDPAYTILAVRLGLLSAGRLLGTVTHGAAIHATSDLARLVQGMALIHGYHTQTIWRLAGHIRLLAAAGDLTTAVGRQVADALSVAGDGSQFVSGDLSRAHRALTHATRPEPGAR